MMTAEELRIGNIISYKGEPTKLLAISMCGLCNVSKFRHYQDQLEMDISDFLPIQLTDELLSLCGYQYANENGQKFYWHLDLPYFQLRKGGDSWEFWYSEDGAEALISKHDIDHLHHLQNIHFYLSAVELSITNISSSSMNNCD